jgi:hypothetical protein
VSGRGRKSLFFRTLPAFVCLATASACSSDDTSEPDPLRGSGAADKPGGACSVETKTVSDLVQEHVPECSGIEYASNPPAGGPHYPIWAAYQSFSFAVPRGFWVHDLEHGGIVYGYNCTLFPDGCEDEVTRVQAMIDALPADPACSGAAPRRVVLTPDPLLDVRWGVSAWGFTLRAPCADIERFRQFYLNHFALGPENLCNPGTDFSGVLPCQ